MGANDPLSKTWRIEKMKATMNACTRSTLSAVFVLVTVSHALSQNTAENQSPDKKVRGFLESHRSQWHDMNIPAADGKILYDLIVTNGYTKALEIGTSTGHSGIWIAWALSKTGGKLVTIEIDEDRYREAVSHFKEAGIFDFVDARLADAHSLVDRLEGPFDFVFCDADKEWYKNYFLAVSPKLAVGGCYAAHNVSGESSGRRSGGRGSREFYQHVKSLANFKTTVDDSGGGVSISYKISEK
jgi:predicted O-methyltransferase YrrM